MWKCAFIWFAINFKSLTKTQFSYNWQIVLKQKTCLVMKLDWILKYEEKKRVIKEKRPCWRVREMPMQRGLRALDLREEEKYKYPLHEFPFATFTCLWLWLWLSSVFKGSSSLSVSLPSIPLSHSLFPVSLL